MSDSGFKYYIFFKPYNCLSQFTREHPTHITLADFCKGIPKNVFPVGRLDKDSEGLLLLTNDPSINNKLLNPKFKHSRTYLAQVEGIPTKEAIDALNTGVEINLKKIIHRTLPAKVQLLENQPITDERVPPIRVRKSIPDSWLKIELTEGKNRQVRKMCAKVGFPVLRLLRVEIENINLEKMIPGELKSISKEEFYQKLKLKLK